jgi:hypothetical protein
MEFITLLALFVSLPAIGSGCATISAGEQACEDLLDAQVDHLVDDCGVRISGEPSANRLTKAEVRRGLEWQMQQNGRTCAAVDYVADAELFYSTCLPQVSQLQCGQAVLIQRLPEACQDQLIIE